jgi:hypothetical protein
MNTGNEKYVVVLRSADDVRFSTPCLTQSSNGNQLFTREQAEEVVRYLVEDQGYSKEDYTILEIVEVNEE